MAFDARFADLSIPPMKHRGPLEVDFRYAAGEAGIEGVSAELATALGTFSIVVPAVLAGIDGPKGAGRLPLDLAAVPGGPCKLALTPLLAGGGRGEGVEGELTVPTLGKVAPKLLALSMREAKLRRCAGADQLHVLADLQFTPGEAAVVAVWARLRGPDAVEMVTVVPVAGAASEADSGEPGAEAARGKPRRTSGRFRLATLTAAHAAGPYELAVALVDAAGCASEPVPGQFDLTERGGVAGPSIDSFTPARAVAGEEVVLRGASLQAEGLVVEVGGVVAGVIKADDKALRIQMPALDAPGRIVVITELGIGRSDKLIAPRPVLKVVPEVAEVAEGSTVQLTGVVQGATDGRVRWSLRSKAERPGSISSEGIYTPPSSGNAEEVLVVATHAADKEVVATARIRIVPQPAARGPLRIGRLGGTVRSQDDSCALTLPAGALPRLRALSVEPELPQEGDEPEGSLVVAQVRLEGAPRVPDGGAVLTMGLRHPLLPGQEVHLRWRDSPEEPWRDLPPDRFEVLPGSEALRLRLEQLAPHFQGSIHYDRSPPSYRPAITAVEPADIDEGATVAVLVTGRHFVAGVTRVSVLKASGQIEPRVSVGQVHVTADGTKVGVTLKAGVMTDLAEGAFRSLTLQVATPSGAAFASLTILGHDELDVQGTVTLASSRRFSRVRVAPGATLRLAHRPTPVVVEAFETLVVGDPSSRATVEVLAGAGSAGAFGNAPPAPGGAGGFGGLAPGAGTASSGGAGGRGGPTGVVAFGGGRPGLAGTPVSGTFAGAGGVGGRAEPVGRAGDGSAGSTPANSFAGFIGPITAGPGGGGGGGGGGEGLIITSTGGGGGGGGAGGGALTLAAGEEVRITGRVQANGGDGGAGAFPFPVGFPPSAPLFHAGCGGGGGGGGGGAVGVYGARWLNGELLAVSGAPGANARFADAVITTPDTRTPLQRLLANPQRGSMTLTGVANAGATVSPPPGPDSVPDLDYRSELVSPTAQVTMTGFGAGQLLVTRASGGDVVQVAGAPAFSGVVTLAPGFNLVEGAVAVLDPVLGPQVSVRGNRMRARRMLFLPGTVPVFTFNCTITPAAPVVATERSVALTATVTGPQKALTWEVDGGAANGQVSATGVYSAPCDVPASGAATVRARSVFDPSRTAAVQVSVWPGIAVQATAGAGTPAVAGQASANVGQVITVSIPPGAQTLSSQRFAVAQNVVFETHARDSASGACTDSQNTVAGTVATGMASLTVTVPPCAAPEQHLRVPGHGCARLQIVPRIQSLNRSAALGSNNMGINGSGFVCGATRIFFGANELPAAQVLSVECGLILVGRRPAPMEAVTVRTAGGTSNAVT